MKTNRSPIFYLALLIIGSHTSLTAAQSVPIVYPSYDTPYSMQPTPPSYQTSYENREYQNAEEKAQLVRQERAKGAHHHLLAPRGIRFMRWSINQTLLGQIIPPLFAVFITHIFAFIAQITNFDNLVDSLMRKYPSIAKALGEIFNFVGKYPFATLTISCLVGILLVLLDIGGWVASVEVRDKDGRKVPRWKSMLFCEPHTIIPLMLGCCLSTALWITPSNTSQKWEKFLDLLMKINKWAGYSTLAFGAVDTIFCWFSEDRQTLLAYLLGYYHYSQNSVNALYAAQQKKPYASFEEQEPAPVPSGDFEPTE